MNIFSGFLSSSTAFDSEGLDFWTSFITNKNGKEGQKTLIFFNNQDIVSNVSVTFKNLSDPTNFFPSTETLNILVPAKSGAFPVSFSVFSFSYF